MENGAQGTGLPLTPTLSPAGRGGDDLAASASTRPSGVRVRVRGAKLSAGRVVRARKLRRAETDAERKFWGIVRGRQVEDAKFVRQFPIGRYVADFVCRERMLVVELDGGQRSESATDDSRTAYLNGRGYAVLRFWNNEIVENIDGCYEALVEVLAGRPSPGWRYAPATLSRDAGGEDGELDASR
jgi:very-short-patch-repair endonuclease